MQLKHMMIERSVHVYIWWYTILYHHIIGCGLAFMSWLYSFSRCESGFNFSSVGINEWWHKMYFGFTFGKLVFSNPPSLSIIIVVSSCIYSIWLWKLASRNELKTAWSYIKIYLHFGFGKIHCSICVRFKNRQMHMRISFTLFLWGILKYVKHRQRAPCL